MDARDLLAPPAPRPLVMGILNITPDSFSDGGRYLDPKAALAQARRMAQEGADIIDIGGESTRPGSRAVSAQEELARIIPVIQALREALPVPISVDTSKPEVMTEAVHAGASLINDVRALQSEGALEAAAATGAAVCLMHMQGEPRTMQQAPHYDDVVTEVRAFFQQRVAACEQAGIPRRRLILDPGFGFGKTLTHNLLLLKHLDQIADLRLPVLVGVSRKSMIGQLANDAPVGERLPGSLALATLAVWLGAAVVRVHDIAATIQAVRTAQAVRDVT